MSKGLSTIILISDIVHMIFSISLAFIIMELYGGPSDFFDSLLSLTKIENEYERAFIIFVGPIVLIFAIVFFMCIIGVTIDIIKIVINIQILASTNINKIYRKCNITIVLSVITINILSGILSLIREEKLLPEYAKINKENLKFNNMI